MRTRKLLNKALIFLLSGAMIAGMIPAVSVTAAAKATYKDHTPDGYVGLWDESFEDYTSGLAGGWTTTATSVNGACHLLRHIRTAESSIYIRSPIIGIL